VRETPADGLVEGNEFGNTHPRDTDHPVTPLDIDNGSRWVVRLNYIHDFHQAEGNRVSYGAYVKGGSQDPIFERNLILCQRNVKPVPHAATIGMSFGGGGMAPAMCAPSFNGNVPCNPEVTGGIMRNNIIANCTDVGIYLNSAMATMVLHNTLIATSGIDVRFPSSTAEIHGNVLTGRIRARNGGTFTGKDNLPSIKLSRFRAWYIDPLNGDLRHRGSLGSLLNRGMPTPLVIDDYCGRARDSKPDWGALEHGIGDCRTTRPWHTW
jgi:parallel beta-helix repeat protein